MLWVNPSFQPHKHGTGISNAKSLEQETEGEGEGEEKGGEGASSSRREGDTRTRMDTQDCALPPRLRVSELPSQPLLETPKHLKIGSPKDWVPLLISSASWCSKDDLETDTLSFRPPQPRELSDREHWKVSSGTCRSHSCSKRLRGILSYLLMTEFTGCSPVCSHIPLPTRSAPPAPTVSDSWVGLAALTEGEGRREEEARVVPSLSLSASSSSFSNNGSSFLHSPPPPRAAPCPSSGPSFTQMAFLRGGRPGSPRDGCDFPMLFVARLTSLS